MNKREQIIFQANRLFFEKDFEKVSLNEIAKKIGMTKGGIYHYFSSKHDLLIEVMRYNFSMIEKLSLSHINESSGTFEIISGFFNITKMSKEIERVNSVPLDINLETGQNAVSIEHFYYFMFMLTIKYEDIREELGTIYDKSIDVITKILEKGQAKKEIRNDIEAKILALQIAAMVEGLMFLTIFKKKDEIEQEQKKILNAIWKQIKS